MSAYAAIFAVHHEFVARQLRTRSDTLVLCLGLIALLLLAYLSNPDDAAFRSFLTDLSFQSHLRRLRSAAAQTTLPSNDAHVLNFSNRIAISLRTPPYVLRSFGFFSTVSTAPHAPKKGRAPDSGEAGQRGSPFTLRGGFFVGAFGRWWAIDDGSSEDGHAEKDRLASSVMAMEVVDLKPSSTPPSPEQQSKEAKTKPAVATTIPISPRRHRSGSSSQLERSAEETPKVAPQSPFQAAPPVSSPLSPAVVELQQQLLDLQTATEEAENKLKADLDALKARKRDEDAARAGLKTRGKAAEEVKRTADHEHAEAAKRATSARVSRQTALDRTHAAEAELVRLDKKSADLVQRADKSAKTRHEREASLRKEVLVRQAELTEANHKARALAEKVEELETAIEERKQAIYARLTQPAMGRPPMLPYAMVPTSTLQWTHMPERSLPHYSIPPPTSQAPIALDFGNIPTPPQHAPSFLEHRMQHMSDTHTTSSVFSPFNSSSPLSVNTSAQSSASRGVPLPLFSPIVDEVDPILSAEEAKDIDGVGPDGLPLSPMTPNHRSLIPSTLFDMLDGDDGIMLDDDPFEAHDEALGVGTEKKRSWPVTSGAAAVGAPLAHSLPSHEAHRQHLSLNPDAKAFSFNRQGRGSHGEIANNAASTSPPGQQRSTDPWTFSPFD